MYGPTDERTIYQTDKIPVEHIRWDSITLAPNYILKMLSVRACVTEGHRK